MSRILRRPMFRGGGKVSSYGNGIASGLANGGRVNLVKGGNPGALVNLGSGANAPTQSVVNQGGNILKRNLSKIKNIRLPAGSNWENRIGSGIKSLYNLLPEEGLLSKGTRFATTQFPKFLKGGTGLAAISGPGIIAEANRPKTYAALQYMKDMNQSGVFDETAIPTMDGELGEYDQFTLEFDRLNDPSKYTAIPDDRGFFNKLLNPLSAITGLGGKSKEEIGLIVDQDEKKIQSAENEAAAASGKEVNVDIKTGNVTEPAESRKDMLKRKAKEYQDILGEGIKKDSIFDAMVEGGSRIYEGEGWGSAVRAANKALDPIQNIKTASRKLALEEDIALQKAIATAAAKDTDMSRRIAALKAGGYSPEQIADAVAGTGRPKSKADYIKDTGSATTGLTLWVKDNVPDLKSLLDKKASKDPKVTASLEDGKHYIPELFTLITIKEGIVVDKEKLK